MLDINWASLLFQVINFVALLVVVNLLVFRPLRAKLAERRRTISDTLQSAEDQEAEAARMRAEWERRRDQAEREAEEIIHAAEIEAERRAARIIEDARVLMERISAEMRDDMERQQDEILARHYDQVLNTVMALAGNVVRAVTTRRAHDDLVTNFCANIFEIPQAEIDAYRHAIAGRAATARVETPVALTDEQHKTLSDTLSSLLDRRVELQVTVNPALIAGISVRVADRLMDNSIRQQLLGIREKVRQELIQRAGVELS